MTSKYDFKRKKENMCNIWAAWVAQSLKSYYSTSIGKMLLLWNILHLLKYVDDIRLTKKYLWLIFQFGEFGGAGESTLFWGFFFFLNIWFEKDS